MTIPESPLPSPPPPKPPRPRSGRGAGCLLWLFAPIIIGVILAFWLVPRPAVGIIRVNTEIYAFSADYVAKQIFEARHGPRIKAVVVQIDTPGGEVVATQAMYMEFVDLRQVMPVVGSIDSMAASCGYYTAMATDPLYAKPSSVVGNVGVWGYFPSTLGVNDTILASGPFKLTASNTAEFLREIEGIKQEFYETVAASRGLNLKISQADLLQGLAYPGREALEFGLIDAIGSQTDAIEKAAEMAKIANYDVIDLEQQVIDKYFDGVNPFYYGNLWYGVADAKTGARTLPPGIYLLYDVRLESTP